MAQPPVMPLWKLAAASGPYVKIAAVNGIAAVILGVFEAYSKIIVQYSIFFALNLYESGRFGLFFQFAGHYPEDEVGQEQRRTFETANRYHFIHTLAMLGLPLCKVPALVY